MSKLDVATGIMPDFSKFSDPTSVNMADKTKLSKSMAYAHAVHEAQQKFSAAVTALNEIGDGIEREKLVDQANGIWKEFGVALLP